jgi:hypothetical protein
MAGGEFFDGVDLAREFAIALAVETFAERSDGGGDDVVESGVGELETGFDGG